MDAIPAAEEPETAATPAHLFRLSDASGQFAFDAIEPATRASLSPADAFLLDDTSSATSPAIYVWVGKDASLAERRLAVQYAQAYLYRGQQAQAQARGHVAASIVKMNEGRETEAFLHALGE